ncbi:phosphatidylinositol-specific phospholipase C, X domain containing protein [Nitzschia inconspicua]|uniref:Phosphatidylinositol-specific phospholipase C, X domain containing protein n=1 Tax=Nitzschia inconspicua TaxID=303405 RepID=A0A9K3KN97_9STRA|nr:phosphatidylinositol-specific phospholipase C, X domain containing protein [Nitzschia inconspicua]
MDFTSRYCRRRVERSLTCPSASIAVNCLQLAVCIPTIPAIDFPISLHPDWMGNLVQSVPDAKLGEMVVPGTHDSASYSIEPYKMYSAVGRTQNVSVLEQLHRGSRFIDLRIAGSGNEAFIFHGCLKGCKLERILDEILLFCQDFQGEFVIINLVAEYGRSFDPKLKKKALDIIKESLGDKMFKGPSVKELLNTPLKELTSSGKQVCIILNPRIYDDFTIGGIEYSDSYISKEYGCFNAGTWMQDKWYNTHDPKQLLEWNLEEVKSKGGQGKLLNNQFVLTPGVGSFGDIVKLALGWASLQPVYLANDLYKPLKRHGAPLLHEFFAQHPDEPWNLVSLDYVDLTPTIMSLLVGLNFSSFDIMLATVQYGNPNFFRPSMSVTSKVQSHVMRGKVLFLNVGKDFGSNFGTLTLAYRVMRKFYSIVIHFDGSSVIVLNEYNHLQAGSKEIVIEEGAEEGSINPGGGGTIMTWSKEEENGGEIEFDFDSPF